MTSEDSRMIAVVTGASTGLGRALSQCLTAQGLHVVGIARDKVQLNDTAQGCPSGQFTALVGDVSQPDVMRDIACHIAGHIGPVSILMNNAVIHTHRPFVGARAEDITDHVYVNCCGQINATAAILPAMMEQGRGRIVNVGSFAGEGPILGNMGYAVSKAGARAFSRALVVELAHCLPTITVSEWIPGILATRSGVPSGMPPQKAAPWGVALALDFSSQLHGKTFLKDQELRAPLSLRRRLKDAFLLRSWPKPHMLVPQPQGNVQDAGGQPALLRTSEHWSRRSPSQYP